MKPKHTPGPWEAFSKPQGNEWPIRRVFRDKQGRRCYQFIGCAFALPEESHFETCEANVRLIADAPETAAERDRLKVVNAEMLEELQEALAILEHNHLEPKNQSSIREVIAKAEGEAL